MRIQLVETGSTRFGDVCRHWRKRVLHFIEAEPASALRRETQMQCRLSLKVCREVLSQYSLEEIAVSFNGGKDCLVMLILLLAVWDEDSGLQTIYVSQTDVFPEMQAFVKECVNAYSLNLKEIRLPLKEAFEFYIQDNPNIKTIFVGTRRCDPWSKHLSHFNPTDRGWPQFLRVHPVIDWHYVEIWDFLRGLDIPYCSLYDQGYTSLGSTHTTRPNPALRVDGKQYKPAYELMDESDERLGRS
jgi:FAD synthetase